MKFTTIFSLLALAAGAYAATDAAYNTASGEPASPQDPSEGVDQTAFPGNDIARCNRYVPTPFFHGKPQLVPGCSAVPIPRSAASSIANSHIALVVGIAAAVYSL